MQYAVYDLKGSTVSREVKELGANVLKDINYFKSNDCFITLNKHRREEFILQVEADVGMLKSHNIMDYSLLIGVATSREKAPGNSTRSKEEREREEENFSWLCYSEDS